MSETLKSHFGYQDGKTRCGKTFAFYKEDNGIEYILLEAVADWSLVTCRVCLNLKATQGDYDD